MNWTWQSCEIHIIQPELGFAVGANTNTEKNINVELHFPTQILPPMPGGGGGATAEWDLYYVQYQYQGGSHYRGRYDVTWNSLNPAYNYGVGSSDPRSRVWRWTPEGDLYIGNVFQQTGTGGGGPTTGMQDNVTLRSATSIAGGVQPLAGRFAVGGGFVNLDFGILRKGPIGWQRI